jgi:hypothetical protein
VIAHDLSLKAFNLQSIHLSSYIGYRLLVIPGEMGIALHYREFHWASRDQELNNSEM